MNKKNYASLVKELAAIAEQIDREDRREQNIFNNCTDAIARALGTKFTKHSPFRSAKVQFEMDLSNEIAQSKGQIAPRGWDHV